MVAIILAGGSHLPGHGHGAEHPLALTSICGQPFLYWLTQWLKLQNMEHIIVSAGHGIGSQKINDAVLHIASLMPNINLDVVTEQRPLGTAGATAVCAMRMPSQVSLVVNGDVILLANIRPYIEKLQHDTKLDGMLVGLRMNNAGRFGALEVNAQNQLTGFYEKQPGTELINAGVYIFKNALLQTIPEDKELSLERDMFPQWIKEKKRFEVATLNVPFVDIETPENLKRAHDQIKQFAAYILDVRSNRRQFEKVQAKDAALNFEYV